MPVTQGHWPGLLRTGEKLYLENARDVPDTARVLLRSGHGGQPLLLTYYKNRLEKAVALDGELQHGQGHGEGRARAELTGVGP